MQDLTPKGLDGLSPEQIDVALQDLTPRVVWIAVAMLVGAVIAAVAAFAIAEAADPPTAKREALAKTNHVRGAPNRSLALSRVVIPAGASLALHHHLGTQVAYIDTGVLSYTVHSGQVTVRTGSADDHPQLVRRIKAGQTGKIRAGQWIVEQPSDIHRAANHGKHRIVIHLATLLKRGAPPSTPVT